MFSRCYNPKTECFKHYGGRGIKVCERWHTFENFVEDMEPSFIEGLLFDRINNDGNYEPGNCRWVTASKSLRNRRSYGSSSYKGVRWCTKTNAWRAELNLGRFDSEEEAAQVYKDAVYKIFGEK